MLNPALVERALAIVTANRIPPDVAALDAARVELSGKVANLSKSLQIAAEAGDGFEDIARFLSERRAELRTVEQKTHAARIPSDVGTLRAALERRIDD